MRLIKEKSNNANVTRYYRISQAKTVDAAVIWINDVRRISSFSTNYIYLSDLTKRFEEGAESVQLDAHASVSEIKKYISENSVDQILINGKYNGHPVVVGVNLYDGQACVTIRKKDPADIDALERELSIL